MQNNNLCVKCKSNNTFKLYHYLTICQNCYEDPKFSKTHGALMLMMHCIDRKVTGNFFRNEEEFDEYMTFHEENFRKELNNFLEK